MKRAQLLTILVLFLLAMNGGLDAQQSENLVPNSSFESEDGRLRRSGQINRAAKFWVTATAEDADLFSRDQDDKEVGSPENYRGYCKPKTGRRFAGFRAYSFRDEEPRSYLSTRLKDKLRAGVTYCVTMYVSLSDLSKYAVNNIGIHLSKNDILVDKEKTLVKEAQIKDPKNRIFKDRRRWKAICAPYEGKGDAEYLTIGNFTINDKLETEKMRRMRRFDESQKFDAYYYVDDVSVVPVDRASDCTCGKEAEKDKDNMKYVYSKRSSLPEDLPPKKTIRSISTYFGFFSAEIESTAEQKLDTLSTILSDNPGLKIDIVGHSDGKEQSKTEEEDHQKEMSSKRAEKVKDYLVSKGISESRLNTVAKKNEDPADDGGTTLARAKNRRVEFVPRE